MWKIVFYKKDNLEEPVRNFIFNLPSKERANKLILIRNLLTGEIYSKSNYVSVDLIFSPLDLKEVNWILLEDSMYRLCLEK